MAGQGCGRARRRRVREEGGRSGRPLFSAHGGGLPCRRSRQSEGKIALVRENELRSAGRGNGATRPARGGARCTRQETRPSRLRTSRNRSTRTVEFPTPANTTRRIS